MSIVYERLYIKGKIYSVKFYPNPEITGNAPEFIIYEHRMKPLNPAKITMSDTHEMWWQEVVRWDFIPDWTPQNIKERLPKALTFL